MRNTGPGAARVGPKLPPSAMRVLALRLVAAEQRRSDINGAAGFAAIRVCDRLGKSLGVLTGARGFSSLMARALRLAAGDVPWLRELTVGATGELAIPPDLEARIDSGDIAKGSEALVTHLLGLLATFIGEALTLRLVQQVWPTVASDPESGGKT